MNSKIGIKETSRTIIFLILPQLILHYIGRGISDLNNGYLINYVISFLIYIIFIWLMKKSFLLTDAPSSKLFNKIIDVFFIIYILLLVLYNLKLCSEAVSSVSSSAFSKNSVIFLPFISAVICSFLGVEAITRTSYISFFISGFIVLFLIIITFRGWDTENMYPLIGSDISDIFTNYSGIGCFFGSLAIYMLRHNFKDKAAAYVVLKRSVIISFIFGLTVSILCILTIPHPMGELYDFSLDGIFSMAKSGSFFHRFELLLLFLLLIFQILSASIGLYILSSSVANILNTSDYRPFNLIFGVILFYANLICKDVKIISILYLGFSVLLLSLLILKSQINKFKYKLFRKG